MSSEPSIRTGFIITILGISIIILGFILYNTFPESLEHFLPILRMSEAMFGDLGPGVLAWGIGWIISAFNPLRKFYLIPVSIGIIMPILTVVFGSPLIELGYLGTLLWQVLIFSASPAFIAAGVISGIVIEKHVKRDKLPKIQVRFEEYLLYLIAIMLFLLFAKEPLVLLRLVGSALACWLIWHFVSPRISYHILVRKIKSSKGKLELISSGENIYESITFTNIFSKVYYPLAFGLGLSLTFSSIVELTPLSESFLTAEPMIKVAQIALLSILTITIGSSYIGPVVWLFKDSGIRIKDNVKYIIEEPKIHGFANNLIEIYSFVQAPISFVIIATGRDYAYAFGLLTLLIITLLTVSLSTTILYVKFSVKKNLHYLLNRLLQEKYLQTNL